MKGVMVTSQITVKVLIESNVTRDVEFSSVGDIEKPTGLIDRKTDMYATNSTLYNIAIV